MKKIAASTNRRINFPLSNNYSCFPKRLTIFAILCCILLIHLTAYTQAPAGYTLSWSDEFNSATLDTAQWKYRIDGSGTSYQVKENVKLDSGKLHIKLKKETYNGKSYTGGGIITKQARRYGYYEVSVKLAGNYGWHEAFLDFLPEWFR